MLHVHSTAFSHPMSAGRWSGHEETGGKAPSIAAVGGSGVTGISIAGNDSAGRVTMSSGTTIANGNVFTLTFAVPWKNIPAIVCTAVLGGATASVTAHSTTGFTLAVTGLAGAGVTSLLVNYVCLGMPN